MQDNQITNSTNFSDISLLPAEGRIVALDLGTKRVGVAISDELQMTVRPLTVVARRSWKELLKNTRAFIDEFDAIALVLGLPYNFDGSESEMSAEARRLARNFSLSLSVPVFLQDERVSSYDAKGLLWQSGVSEKESRKMVDSQAAAIILGDFLAVKEQLKSEKLKVKDF